MSWKVKSTKEIFKNKRFSVTDDDVVTETGYELTWSVIHGGKSILVIPWDGKYTYLIGQYRHPVKFFSWEFVQGSFEHTSVADTASHELEEEAGLKAEKFEEIGRFFPLPGRNDQEYFIFLATGISQGIQNPEPDEVLIKIKKVTLNEISEMIKKGEVKDGPTIAAYGLFTTYLKDKFSK